MWRALQLSVALAGLLLFPLGSPSQTAAGVTYELVSAPTCATGTTLLGRACVDRPTIPNWTIADGSAQYILAARWHNYYGWQVPQTVVAGTQLSLSLTATEQTGVPNARICPAIIVSGGFPFQGEPGELGFGLCAEGGKSESGSKTAFLQLPNAAAGSTLSLIVRLQDGPTYTYTYRGQGAPAAPTAPAKAVSVTLAVKAQGGSYGSSAKVENDKRALFRAVVSPALPPGATTLVRYRWKGGVKRAFACSRKVCRGYVAWGGDSIEFEAVVISGKKVLAKSAPVTVAWGKPTPTTDTPRCRKTQSSSSEPVRTIQQIPKYESIQQTPEFRAYLGLCDPQRIATRRAWGGWIVELANEYVQRVSKFPGVKSESLLEAEEYYGKHSAILESNFLSTTDLWNNLSLNIPPNALLNGPDANVFALNTAATYEGELRKLIVASKGGLLPADVVELALRATNGSYPLAVLTAHNLLKNITKDGRQTIDIAILGPEKFKGDPELFLQPLREHNLVLGKLVSLRWNPARERDKAGPWYHIFAVTSAGALPFTGSRGRFVSDAEHLAKKNGFFDGEGGYDVIKHQIDNCFAFATDLPGLMNVSRGFGPLYTVDLEYCLLGAIKYATD